MTQTISSELAALLEAEEIIQGSLTTIDVNSVIWDRVYHAKRHVQKSIDAYFLEAA